MADRTERRCGSNLCPRYDCPPFSSRAFLAEKFMLTAQRRFCAVWE